MIRALRNQCTMKPNLTPETDTSYLFTIREGGEQTKQKETSQASGRQQIMRKITPPCVPPRYANSGQLGVKWGGQNTHNPTIHTSCENLVTLWPPTTRNFVKFQVMSPGTPEAAFSHANRGLDRSPLTSTCRVRRETRDNRSVRNYALCDAHVADSSVRCGETKYQYVLKRRTALVSRIQRI